MSKKHKIVLTLLGCVIIAAAVVVSSTATFAIWSANDHDSLYIKTTVTDENPSLKYQMFVPVKASGNGTTTSTSAYTRIAGTWSVVNNVYTYTKSDTSSTVVGFALAGWFGGISLEYVRVPAAVTVTVNGEQVTKDVVRIMADEDFADYKFAGNSVLKKVEIGSRVIEIDRGAFLGMHELETVILDTESGAGNIYIREYAFAYCPSLVTFNNQRTKAETWDTATITAGSFA
jgi:hypothetical protein